MRTYKAIEGARISDADAEKYGSRLSELEEAHGSITPEMVVEDARDRSSPLHAFFEWNNKKAAESYRKEQAQYLIRSIAVVVVDTTRKGMEEKRIRVWHSVKNADGESIYVDIDAAKKNDDYMEQILEYAYQQIKGWQERYEAYENVRREFSEVFAAIEHTRKKRKQMVVQVAS